jgi:hypothetical protein
VFIACALFVATAPSSVKAQTTTQYQSAQSEIDAYISPSSAFVTCTYTKLAQAVANAIKNNSDSTLTPAIIAQAALLPYPYPSGSVRAEPNRDAAAVIVTGSALTQLIASGSTPNFVSQVAAIGDRMVDVNSSTSGAISSTAQSSVISTVLSTITNAYFPASTTFRPTLLSSITSLGQKLLGDSYLENLPNKALTNVLVSAMLGITGTDPAMAPTVAADFVTGLITTSSNTFAWPDESQGATSSTFTVNIISKVVGNTGVDELVANVVGTQIYANSTANRNALISLGEALFTAYPASNPAIETKLFQGLEAAVTQGTNEENQRVAFIQDFTPNEVASAANIEEGAIYTDPYYASQFTSGLFGVLYHQGAAVLSGDAAMLATDAGNMLGADGNELTQVANVYSSYISSGELSASNVGTYAANLLNGAIHGTVAAQYAVDAWGNGGGGKLAVASGITTATVIDLASVTDVLADGVVAYFRSQGTLASSQSATAAGYIGTLAEDVAALAGTETFTDSANTNRSGYVAAYIAGTLADYIVALGVSPTAYTDILNAIKSDVEAISANSAFDSAINTAVTQAENRDSAYVSITGPIDVQETTVTNL